MSLVSLLLVVLAALHPRYLEPACRSAPPHAGAAFVFSLSTCSPSIIYLPWMIWLPGLWRPDTGIWPVIVCIAARAPSSISATACACSAAMQVADLSVVYPVARGTGPSLSSIARPFNYCCREAPTTSGFLGLFAVVARHRAHHDAGRPRRVQNAARPRWRALGHRDGIADCGLSRSSIGYGVKVLKVPPCGAGLALQSVALLPAGARRDAGLARGEEADARPLVAGTRGRRARRRCPTSSCSPQSKWAPRSAWSRPRAEMSMMVGAMFGMRILGGTWSRRGG